MPAASHFCNIRNFFKGRQIKLQIAVLDAVVAQRIREILMTLGSMSPALRTAPKVNFNIERLRALIAEYTGVDPERVTDEAHFSDDLHLDRLDRLELMILIEDEFDDIEIAENDANQIEAVGDLIRILKS
jgi:acyl carrier protein